MTAAAQDNQEVNRRVLWSTFGYFGILRNRKTMEEGLVGRHWSVLVRETGYSFVGIWLTRTIVRTATITRTTTAQSELVEVSGNEAMVVWYVISEGV